jgi:hypothetical protein
VIAQIWIWGSHDGGYEPLFWENSVESCESHHIIRRKIVSIFQFKNKPSKKPARSKQQAELALLVTALSSLTVLQFMEGSIPTWSLELEQSRNRHFVLHLPICHICPHESTWYCGHCLASCTRPRWWWLWSNRWKEKWQEKQKYSEKTRPTDILSTINSTWTDPGSNPVRRVGKPTTNRLSYGKAVLSFSYSFKVKCFQVWTITNLPVFQGSLLRGYLDPEEKQSFRYRR